MMMQKMERRRKSRGKKKMGREKAFMVARTSSSHY